MNDNQQPNPVPTPTEVTKGNPFNEIIAKIKLFISPFWQRFTQTKFYTNKKIFYPIAGMFGLMFLIIILGLLFGNRKPMVVRPTPTPTPITSEVIESPTPKGDALSVIEQKLLDLKSQIDSLDIKQSRLQPPSMDFKISF